MIKQLIDEIDAYIQYLKKEHNLYLTLHTTWEESLVRNSSLIKYNLHMNPYCLYLKTNQNLWKKCISKQERIFEKCRNGRFSSMYHAGVQEFIYPIMFKDKVMGFISVSGYCSDPDLAKSRISRTVREFDFPLESVLEIYHKSITTQLPRKDFLDAVINPLCRMLELGYMELYQHSAGHAYSENDALYLKILNYIHMNYHYGLNVAQISDALKCSISYISHLFKRKNGRSIRDYINYLRINEARTLLETSTLTIQEISNLTGFSDSNYFSVVFKRMCGCSPRAYRKSAIHQE